MLCHQRNYAILNLFYGILTKTSKYIKPPLKLSDTDHAPNVADITNQLIELLTKGVPGQELYTEGLELITVHSNVSNTSFQNFISALKNRFHRGYWGRRSSRGYFSSKTRKLGKSQSPKL